MSTIKDKTCFHFVPWLRMTACDDTGFTQPSHPLPDGLGMRVFLFVRFMLVSHKALISALRCVLEPVYPLYNDSLIFAPHLMVRDRCLNTY